ncbi:MAG TPA: hypothetical protein VIH20_04980 [Candidatus Subteraquimicrobiales bacterium]
MGFFDFPEEFQNKIVDTPSGSKCICDLCGEKRKIGALSFDRVTNKPLIICYDCTLEISAEREGITKKEAEKRRKRMFGVGYLFNEVKMAEYLEQKGKKEFTSLEEQRLLEKKLENIYLLGSSLKNNRDFIDQISVEIQRRFGLEKYTSKEYKAKIKVKGERKEVDNYLVLHRHPGSPRYYDKEYQEKFIEPSPN